MKVFLQGSGTYTVPKGVSHLTVKMTGGGGGGSGIFDNGFDRSWANKYSIKCQALSERLPGMAGSKVASYGAAYRLHYFTWKLKIWKV